MLTNTLTRSGTVNSPHAARLTGRTVMIVNGGEAAIELLDAVLDAGHYDIVLVESTAHAYSQIKRLQPGLVVLCTNFARMESFHVLSMLKLDEDTKHIPVLTCAADMDGQESAEDDEVGSPAAEVAALPAVGRMH